MIDDNINYEYIIRYIRSSLRKSEGNLAEMERFAKEYEVPISQPETIKLIELLIRIGRVKDVLEVGAAIGYSAIRMVYAGAGRVDSVEINPDAVRVARQNAEREGMSENIHIIEGDAKEVLPTLEGEYDMIFIDAAKGQYSEFFGHCMRMLRPGGILVSDNILYKGMTATDELVLHRKRTIVKRLREYIDMLCNHPELDTDIIPVGDGIGISVKLDKAGEK